MDKAMRPTRLFAFAAAGFAVLALFWETMGRQPALDFYVHDVYFVVFNRLVILAAAVICGIFALLYFGCGRLLRIPLNRGLSLTNFLLVVLPLGALVWGFHSIHPNFGDGPDSWAIKFMLISTLAEMTCFLIGGMVFVLNFGWTLVRVLRTRV
jgi:hypothetical protein